MNASKKRDLSDVPLYISLQGDLFADTSKMMVGSVLGDKRLVALDAFLDALSNAKEFQEASGNLSMGDALRQMVEKCHPNILAKCDIIMKVTCKMDTEKKEITHTFQISAVERK
jgi:hypothetical protein